MKQVAIIGASGGIGMALTELLLQRGDIETLYAFSRSTPTFTHKKVTSGKIDITDEDSISRAASLCHEPLDLIIVATGMLQYGEYLPEKSLKDINLNAMQHCYAVNTFGPALVAKYFLPLLVKDKRSVFAALSARVGSISDNGIGGWYSYRASKAALNMVIKNAAIEVARRYKEAIIIGLHPGTVDTNLSKPFQSQVKHNIFTPERSASYLLDVIAERTLEDSGKCFAWDGRKINP